MIRVEDIAADPAFRHLRTLRGVPHDLRYAGPHNFAGRNLYGRMDCAWLRREAADGLELAADWLQAQRPGWRILVLDALRPQRVQEAIWVDVAGTPMQEYFANPERGIDSQLRHGRGRDACWTRRATRPTWAVALTK
jgi:D-alanyl-D-alanine dipeptidase